MHAGRVELASTGPLGKPVLSAACFDANVKANRYKCAGRASSSCVGQGEERRFFGKAHADLWQLHAQGPLPLSSGGVNGSSSGSQLPGDSTAAADAVD